MSDNFIIKERQKFRQLVNNNPASIVSFFIELIPKVGGKIANILHDCFKSFTVDRVLKNASINMQSPNDTEFKIYIDILTNIINLETRIDLDALNKKQLKDLTEKFFDFAESFLA